ncbi:hypothetical protein FSP39_007877 [Pinctada imbricata]|uniref:Uncharacterized protein n=1 Tax=Pinctada imbricata TaxID=66713 RepID=A0AA89C9Q9_PINIB|nr:hypothetical protein FSP39_007877 [Pinctada imbricata]
MFNVPAKYYDEEPASFLVKKSALSEIADYTTEPIRTRRRSVSEFRSYDPSWPLIMDRYLKARESYNPASRPSRRSHYDYRKTAIVDDYLPYRPSPSIRKPLPPAKIPILHKSEVPFLRKIMYSGQDSTGDILEAKRQYKHDAVTRGALRQDLMSLLHFLYGQKVRDNIRSATDYNMAEIKRLDRKQDKISRYIQDFKRDTIKQRLPMYHY